jgi:hypothetical protein
MPAPLYARAARSGAFLMARADLSNASLAKLAGALKPAQIIAIGVFLVTLVSGSFGFGFWLSARLGEVDSAALKSEVAALKGKAAQAEGRIAALEQSAEVMRVKERILGLLALYYTYRERAAAADATDEDRQKHEEARRNLFREVMDRARPGAPGGEQPSVKLRVGKGTRPSLTFESDQTTWPLPPEVFATAN